jgi:hypothetical protein
VEFKKNNVIRHVKLPVIDDCSVDVGIVSGVRGGEYGFVTLAHPPLHFWIQNEGFEIHKFDESHLFVSIQDWYILELERHTAK